MTNKTMIAAACVALAWVMGNPTDAAPVGTNDAARAVRAWVRRGGVLGAKLGAEVASVGVNTTTNDLKFYSVQMVGGGTVFTSADDGLEPILAFSSEQSAAAANDPKSPLYTLLHRDIVGRAAARSSVKRAAASASVTASQPEAKWSQLLAEAARLEADAANGVKRPALAAAATVGDLRVAPLLKTKWGQETDGYGNPCYNAYTPNNYVCGCVATAMAQIMFYHKWPQTSRPPVTKDCFVDDQPMSRTSYGGTYDWANIPLEPNGADADAMTATQLQAIGKLCYDAGVSVRMNWGYSGSGTFAALAGEALRDVFGYGSAYSSDCEDGSDPDSPLFSANISHKVLSNLGGGFPVIFGISGSYDHAVVGDGYGYNDGNLYVHLNMGWDGSDDVWYNLPEIGNAYSSIEDIVYNIIPGGGDGKAVLSGRVTLPSRAPAGAANVAIYAVGGADEPVTNVVANAYGVYGVVLPAGSRYEVRATLGKFSGSFTMYSDETLSAPRLFTCAFNGYVGERLLSFSTAKYVEHCYSASGAASCYGNRAWTDVEMSGTPSGTPLVWNEETSLAATQFASFSHVFSVTGGDTPYAWNALEAYERTDLESSSYDGTLDTPFTWKDFDNEDWAVRIDLGFDFPFGSQVVNFVKVTENGTIRMDSDEISALCRDSNGNGFFGGCDTISVARTANSLTIGNAGGTFTLHEDGTITVAFHPDVVEATVSLSAFGQRFAYSTEDAMGALNDMELVRRGLPAGLTLDAAVGTLSGKPEFAGEQAFDVVVTDPFGQSLTNAFTLSVAEPTNRKPVIDGIDGCPASDTMYLKSGDNQEFDIHVSDPDSDNLTVRIYVNGELDSIAKNVPGTGRYYVPYHFSGELTGEEFEQRVFTIKITVSDGTWQEKVMDSWTVKLYRDWYVDAATKEDWDVQDGSSAHPFDAGQLGYFGYMFGGDGDTVYVKPGEYYNLEISEDIHATIVATDGPDVTRILYGVRAAVEVYGEKGKGDDPSYLPFENVVVRGFEITGPVIGGTLEKCRVQGVNDLQWNEQLQTEVLVAAVRFAQLVNCVVIANAGAGVENSTLYNCTVTENAGLGVDGNSCAYNTIVWANGDGNVSEGTYLESCCTAQDPLLADPASGDCRLRVGSPCEDAGDNAYVPSGLTNDFNGVARVQGGQVDIGAYEGANVSGFVIRASAVGNGTVTPSSAIVDAGGEATFAFSTDRPLDHITTNGVPVAVDGDSFVWRNVQSDGELVAYFRQFDFYVDAANGSDSTEDGTSPETAFATIGAALEAAREGETVYVLPGVYGPIEHLPDANRNPVFRRIESTDGAAVTIVDGEGTSRCVTDEMSGLTMVGFTFRNGRGEPSGGGVYGGTYYSCFITNCLALAQGGGAVSATLYDCTIVGNTAGGGQYSSCYGGGISNCDASNCVIRANAVRSSKYAEGGGFYSGTLKDCRVSDNYVCTAGGSDGYYCKGGGGYSGEADGGTYIWNNWSRTENQFDYPTENNVYYTTGDFHLEAPPARENPVADLAELAVVFGDVPEVTNNITNDSELAAFNDFLSSIGVTSAASLSAAQKVCAYPSFVLSGILVTPTLFETRPELKIDAFAPKAGASGEWTLTVSLRAGAADTAMVAAQLAENIKVGTDVNDITHAPTLTEVPSADADTLTFALDPGASQTFFVRIVVAAGRSKPEYWVNLASPSNSLEFVGSADGLAEGDGAVSRSTTASSTDGRAWR